MRANAQILGRHTSSLTPEDFAKTAVATGLHTVVSPSDESGCDSRFVLLRSRHLESIAVLDGRIPDNNLYSLITFRRQPFRVPRLMRQFNTSRRPCASSEFVVAAIAFTWRCRLASRVVSRPRGWNRRSRSG